MFWWTTKAKALEAAVREAGRRTTELIATERLSDDHAFPPLVSHFGGLPYLEEDEEWPITGDGHPYDFVCQVNLTECPERPRVPFDLFTVFYAWDMESEVDAQACVVRTYKAPSATKALRSSRPMPRCQRDYKVRACSIRIGVFVTYPWSMPDVPAINRAASRFRHPERAYSACLRRLGALHDMRSRVGGYATWVHNNTLEHDDMILLAQIDYEPSANNGIGDAAPIYIAISASDPKHIETDTFQSS